MRLLTPSTDDHGRGRYWRQSQWTERWTPKFNVSGRHQVNPVGSGENEKAMVKVGNKNERWELCKSFTNQHGRWLVKIFPWLIFLMVDFDGIDHFLLPTTSCLQPLLAPILVASWPPTGLTWCLPQHWTLVFNASFTDFGVSNALGRDHLCLASVASFLDVISCARPVTLEFGLRTIPSRYLRSANWAQSYSMSLDPLLVSKYLLYCRLGKLFFFFHLLPNSSVSPTSCILTIDMVVKNKCSLGLLQVCWR